MESKQRAIGEGLKNILKIERNLILTEEVNCFAVYSSTWNPNRKEHAIRFRVAFFFGEDKDSAFESAKRWMK